MKALSLFLVGFILISCGKDSTSSKRTGEDSKQEEQEKTTASEEKYLDASSIDETEFQNITINEAVTISGERIVFNKAISVQQNGLKLRCSLTANTGDIWNLRQNSSGLVIEFPGGARRTYKPVSIIDGVYGSWVWSGKVNGVKTFQRISLLPQRLIINQDCES